MHARFAPILAVLALTLAASFAKSGAAAPTDASPLPFHAAFDVELKDPNPGAHSPFVMRLKMYGSSVIPNPRGGLTYDLPPGWDIAAAGDVPFGDNVGALRIAVSLYDACPLLATTPTWDIDGKHVSVPLYNAPIDPIAAGLPIGEYGAHWVGRIGYGLGVPVHVLLSGDQSSGIHMQLFVGHEKLPLPFDSQLGRCFDLGVGFLVRGRSESGAPVSTNPQAEGTYTFEVSIAPLGPLPYIITLSDDVQIVTTPHDPPLDSDGDGVPDAFDRCPDDPGPAVLHGCPPPPDGDHDGAPDAIEELFGTDPTDFDSDDDGIGDGSEIGHGYNPLAIVSYVGICDVLHLLSVNGDSLITSADLAAVAKTFGARLGTSPYGEHLDVNGDGTITSSDLAMVAQRFGYHCA